MGYPQAYTGDGSAMKIIQILPAPEGLDAVFVNRFLPDDDGQTRYASAICLALVEVVSGRTRVIPLFMAANDDEALLPASECADKDEKFDGYAWSEA